MWEEEEEERLVMKSTYRREIAVVKWIKLFALVSRQLWIGTGEQGQEVDRRVLV